MGEVSARRSVVSRGRGPGLRPRLFPKSSPEGKSGPCHPISPDASMLLGKYEFVWTPKRRTAGILGQRDCRKFDGFGDLSHFNRVFRRRYGATPSDVRAASLARTR